MEFFPEALREIWPELKIVYLPSDPAGEQNLIEIKSSFFGYGFIRIDNAAKIGKVDLDLFHNAISLLLIILNNNDQKKVLADEKLHLQTIVREKIRATRELEAFSYSVSHDLRAPVRHISGFVGFLNEKYRDLLPAQGQTYLDSISDSTEQMGKMIDDLLEFARSGQSALHISEIDMNAVFREAMDTIMPDIRDRKIKLIVPGLPVVNGDYNLLCMVWINIMSNAVKFTSFNKKAVIEAGFKEDPEEFIFYVKDNGIGFDMAHSNKLFGVFQRLHTSGQFEGTGIGLANVRRIINKHGGRVWAEGIEKKGATFYFSLPKKISNFSNEII